MSKDTRQLDHGKLAVLHRAGRTWRVLVARVNGATPEVTATREFGVEDESSLRAWVGQQAPSLAIVVIPAGAAICRTCSLPVAEPDQLEQALRLQAEAYLLGTAPPHRTGLAVLAEAPAETNRTGVIVAWPEVSSFQPPDLPVPTRFAPDIAALAALINGDRPTDPLLWVDRGDGSVAIALSHANGVVLRATREDLHGPDGWQQAAGRALAETGLNVSHTAGFIQSVVEKTNDDLASLPAGDATLILPQDIYNANLSRLGGVSDDRQWWARFGIAAGILLAHTGELNPLTGLEDELPLERPSIIRSLSDSLARPSTAIKAMIVFVLVAALGPLVFNGLRLQILKLRHGDLERQLELVNQADQLRAMYDELGRERWTMTKLLADVACYTPEGIKLEAIRISYGDGISVKGRAVDKNDLSGRELISLMREQLDASRIFTDVSASHEDQNTRGYEFDLTAKIASPHWRDDYDESLDFGVWPLGDRLYGDKTPPSQREAVASADDGDGGEGAGDGDAGTEDGGDAVAVEYGDLEDRGDADEPDDRETAVAMAPDDDPEDDRTPRSATRLRDVGRSGRSGGGDKASVTGGDSMSSARSKEMNIPEPLTEVMVQNMNKQEVLSQLSAVAEARKTARSSGDQELIERLTRDWDMLIQRNKELSGR